MKFSVLALSLLTAFTTAAPVSETEGSFSIPSAAVLGQFPIDSINQPVFAQADGKDYILIVNTTELGATLSKREASADAEPWDWFKYQKFQPINKREADAEPWGWFSYQKFQPINKREADAEAEPWGWFKYQKFQPINKREADAEAEPWGWFAYQKFQPIN